MTDPWVDTELLMRQFDELIETARRLRDQGWKIRIKRRDDWRLIDLEVETEEPKPVDLDD